MLKGKFKQTMLVNNEGLSYRIWHNEVKDLLGKLYGLDVDNIHEIDPHKLWEANLSVGKAVGICVGSEPNPLAVWEDNYFVDDFPGYEFNQTFAGEFV
jgi:hypothetical protein